MAKRRPHKTVRLEIGIWYNEAKEDIRISAPGVPGFKLTTVRRDPTSKRGHPHLFGKLAQYLRDQGVPAPEVMSGA